MSARTDITR